MRKSIAYILILVILIALAILYFHYGPPPNKISKCPDDYPDTDAGLNEKMAEMDKWTNQFYDNHPGATLGDWNKARYQFWVDNKCTKAIERYNEAKKLSNN